MAELHVVTIEVDQWGNFSYGKGALRVKVGDTVTWECPSGNFAVSFERSPFEDVHFSGTPRVRADAGMVQNVPYGSYHYAVAVAVGSTLWINAGCPEIIVRR
jgi:hypothetical protein